MRTRTPVDYVSTIMVTLILACGASAQPACNNRCHADWNESCTNSTQDIFDFLADYFNTASNADFNCDGTEGVQDLFDFLEKYFVGCELCREVDLRNVGLPAFIVPGCDFDATFTLVNDGTCPLSGNLPVSAVLSINTVYGDGDDVVLPPRTLTVSPPLPAHTARMVTVSFNCPNPLTLTTQNIRFCIDRTSVARLCPSGTTCMTRQISVSCPDISVASVSVPPGDWISGASRTVAVTVVNHGPCAVDTCPTLVLGSSTATAPCIAVPAFGSRTVNVIIVAPPSEPDCGQPDPFVLRACAFPPTCDRNPADNCLDTTVMITDPYWDARLEINGPSSICACQQSLNYSVTVTNHGNSLCPGVTVCAALVADTSSTCANTIPNPGIACFGSGPIQPGSSVTIGYSYPNTCGFLCQAGTCGFNCQIQRLKAWISSGDSCSSGNCDSERIDIRCCP